MPAAHTGKESRIRAAADFLADVPRHEPVPVPRRVADMARGARVEGAQASRRVADAEPDRRAPARSVRDGRTGEATRRARSRGVEVEIEEHEAEAGPALPAAAGGVRPRRRRAPEAPRCIRRLRRP